MVDIRETTYLLVQEVEISGALILGLCGLLLGSLLLGIPVGLVVIPLILLTIVIC